MFKKLTIGVAGFVLLAGTALAAGINSNIGVQQYMTKVGDNVVPISSSYELGSASRPWAKVWATEIDGGTVTITSVVVSGDLTPDFIVLDPLPDADDTGAGTVISVDVDTNAVGIGACLYMASDGSYDEADADAAASMPCSGIALETSTGTKRLLTHGYIRVDDWNWTPGGVVYVSTTQGTLTQTAPTGTGDQVQVVGLAQSADVVYFNPSFNLIELQ